MNKSYTDGTSYLWFLKCTEFNRGRGIEVFGDIEKLVE